MNTAISGAVSFELAAWLFPLAIAVHNLEEAIWLPAWSTTAGRWHVRVGDFEFRFAVSVLTALAVVATLAALGSGAGTWGVYWLCGYAAAMLLNVFVPHLLGSLLMCRYVPGTATAVLLNLPVTTALLVAAEREGVASVRELVASGAVASLILLVSIPILFALGRRIVAVKR